MHKQAVSAGVILVAAAAVVYSFGGVWLAPAEYAGSGKVPLFDGLGSFGRPVTTNSTEAQRYFNQGLCFLYAFNHDEAIRSFEQAAQLDPDCAMAWWGIALANGPHINNPVVSPESAEAAWQALEKARGAAPDASPVEQALIAAVEKRYADPQPADRKPLDEAYANAMREVWKAYSDDADVGALFAESLMDLRPWDLWTLDEQPQPGTEEVVATLEDVMRRSPNHPLALHLYIHAVEASAHPEKADVAADRLRNRQPGLGHLVHMPSHVDVRRGRWKQAIEANAKAIAADDRYAKKSPRQGFYHVYMAHNHHMQAYAASMRGQSRLAIDSINAMARGIPAEFVEEKAALVDGFTAMPLEMLVRFGLWEDVLAAAGPPDFLPIARCLWRCDRGIAHAARGEVDQARHEQAEFLQARAQVPADARFGNNKASDLLDVGEHLLAGEILFRDGKRDEGIAELTEAVRLEDQLRYSEPPDWIHPVRHALGAALLAAGRGIEADVVYREDLRRLPENGWSLYGLARALRLQDRGREAGEIEARFAKVWSDADVKIGSSCFCQTAATRRVPDDAPFPAHKVVGNVYYVGSKKLASYLITTPEGHILINSGYEETVPLIRAAIESLGFKMSDVKILLASHAHNDHVAGHALAQELSGAKVYVMRGDDGVIAAGGPGQYLYTDARWRPCPVDRVLSDGDEVKIGGETLVARLTPGHTRGCTTWTWRLSDSGKTYNVVVIGSPNVNPGYRLVGNQDYPDIAEDYAKTFRVLKSLPCDVFLGAHGDYYGMSAKFPRLSQSGPNPFVDPAGYLDYVDLKERAFRKNLEEQRAALK